MRNRHFLNIVRKLGKKNCTIIFLEKNLNESTAFEKEKYYISYYRQKGVHLTNISNGGDGSSGWFENVNEEEKERHREVSKSFLGKHHTEETKRKMSEAALGRHIMTDEGKKRLSELRKIPIEVYENKVLICSFSCIGECADYYGINESTIRNAIKYNDGFIRSKYKQHSHLTNFQFKFKSKEIQSTIESIG